MDEDLKKAIEYHKRGEYGKAREYYLRAVGKDPANPRLRVLLGNTFYYDGHVEEGIAQYREAIRIDPEYCVAYFNLAIALEHKGDVEGAIENYRKAIEKNPEYAEAYANLGALLKECGEVDEAITCLRKALEIDKSLEAPRKKLQQILNEVHEQVRVRERIREAEEYIKDGDIFEEVGDLDRAIECYRNSIRVYPSIVGHFLLGLALEKKGDMKGATENYRALLEMDVSNIRDFTADTLNILGKRLGKLRFTDEDLVKMLKKLHSQVKERKLFISMIGYVIKESVQTAEDYIRLGSECEQKGDLHSAVDYYRRAVELEPFSPMPYYILGLALERLGRKQEAIRNYQRAMELDIGSLNPEASQKLAEALARQIGNVYVSFLDSRQLLMEFKDYARSTGEASFETFLRRKITGEAESKIEEGYLLDREGTLDVAIQRYQEAVEIDPNNLVAHYILGLALESKGDYEGAIRRYRESEKVDLDRAPREISRRVIEILNKYLTKTTKDGHRVGTILMRYFEIISQNPEKMTQLLSYIEDIKLDTLSKILKTYVEKAMKEGGGGVIIRDMEDFAENVEEKLKLKRSEELSQVRVRLAWKYKTGRAIRCAAMSAGGEVIAGGSENGKIYFINQKGELIWKKKREIMIVDIDVSPEGEYIAVGLQSGVVELFDSAGGLVWKRDFSKHGVTCLAVSGGAEYTTVATRDCKLITLDRFGEVVWERSVDGYCTRVDISHSGREIIACSDVGFIYFIRNEGLVIVDSIHAKDTPYSVAVSPEGRFYASGSTSGKVYLMDREKQVLWKQETMSPIYGLAVSRDGKNVVAGTSAGVVYLYDEKGDLLWKYPTGVNIWDTDISEDGTRTIAGCGLVFGDIYHFIT
ncbi:MAG: tetratricopeptide repeat protein [Euryarchaeota archaeon]|nr:tetratricopeptide repeat protein [Euryarchaeota archaeon]